MPTIIPDQKTSEKSRNDEIESGIEKEDIGRTAPPLGQPQENKKFWFQRGKDYDPHEIATQVRRIPQLDWRYVVTIMMISRACTTSPRSKTNTSRTQTGEKTEQSPLPMSYRLS